MNDQDYLYSLLVAIRIELLQGNDSLLNHFMQLGLLPKVASVLQLNIDEILCEALWIMINLSAVGSAASNALRAMGVQYKLVELAKKSKGELKINVIALTYCNI